MSVKNLLIAVLCLLNYNRGLGSSIHIRTITSFFKSKQFLKGAVASIAALQLNPLTPSFAYGPTDVEIKIQRLKISTVFLRHELNNVLIS